MSVTVINIAYLVQMLRIPETEFIGRILEHHPEVGEKGAKLFYVALWKLLIDARSKERKTKVGLRLLNRKEVVPSGKKSEAKRKLCLNSRVLYIWYQLTLHIGLFTATLSISYCISILFS